MCELKVTLFASILVISTLCFGQAPEQDQEALSMSQIMDLLEAGMEGEVLAKTVEERGIDFEPTDDDLAALRKAGAQDVLITAIRVAKPRPITREEVLKLMVAGVPSPRAATLVKQRGIDFKRDEEHLGTLRVAGADETLLAAVRAAGQTPFSPGTVCENRKDGLKYVWIPPGSFMMGCSPNDSKCGADEKPGHRVTISKGFWLGQTEVTVGAYKRFATATGTPMPSAPRFNSGWGNEQMPIVNAHWNDADAYCRWAGGRLPTEAEWEYAARAGSTEARYGPLNDIAWHKKNSGRKAHEVGQKRPNAFNLVDMLGNVWEWVSDWYQEDYYGSSSSTDAVGPTGGEKRVLRGGSWNYNSRNVRVSFRVGLRPDSSGYSIGWRCVREVLP